MVADALLITLPIRTIRKLKGDISLRRRLFFIFAASCITTTVSLTQAILNILNVGFGVLVAAEMEARVRLTGVASANLYASIQCWVSLLVCNLGIVMSFVMKKWRGDSYDTTSHKGGMSTHGRSTQRRTLNRDIEISVLKFSSTVEDPVETSTAINSKAGSKANSFRAPESEEFYAPNSPTKFDAM